MPKKKKEEIKLPPADSKVVKYFVARTEGKNQTEAATIAGYSLPETHSTRVEQSKGYQALAKTYKDELLEQISMKDIAREHLKVLAQDSEMGPKLMAIKMATDRIDPVVEGGSDKDEAVFVVLK